MGAPQIGALMNNMHAWNHCRQSSKAIFLFARYYADYANEHTPSGEQLPNTHLKERSFFSVAASETGGKHT